MYLLSELARPSANPTSTSTSTSTSTAGGNTSFASSSAAAAADALDSFLSTELPPAALLPPAAAAAAAAAGDGLDGPNSSSFLSGAPSVRRRGLVVPAGTAGVGVDDSASWAAAAAAAEEQEQQRREAAAVEWRLLRDCLYVFQGIDGQHLVYDAGSGAHLLDPEVGGGKIWVVACLTQHCMRLDMCFCILENMSSYRMFPSRLPRHLSHTSSRADR